MPSVLSKPLQIGWGHRTIPKGATEGGTASGDFHFWIEDMEGNVVFDPVFSHYKMVCNMRNLDINKPHRFAWNNQHRWCKHYDLPSDIKAVNTKKGRKVCRNAKPMPLNCRGNCIAHFVSHLRGDDSKYIIRIGSMGWESKTNANKIWWEFG